MNNKTTFFEEYVNFGDNTEKRNKTFWICTILLVIILIVLTIFRVFRFLNE